MGYGAMRLTGPGIYGPPKDRGEAIAVLREAVASGVNHIDTSDYYGPHVVNEIIREALSPYPDDLVIVTKLGARRATRQSVASRHVSRRTAVGPGGQFAPPRPRGDGGGQPALHGLRPWTVRGLDRARFEVLAELQREGLIRHLGLSNVTMRQFDETQRIAPVACVQNEYNLVHRGDDELIVLLSEMGIAYVPFFPLGGFSPLQSDELSAIAAEVGATPMQVALAWLLQRSPNILLIPGTSSRAHLRENLAAAELELSDDVLVRLDAIGEKVAA